MLNLHRVLFCAGMDFDDTMHNVMMIYFLSIAYNWLVTTVVIAYHLHIGVPQNQPN